MYNHVVMDDMIGLLLEKVKRKCIRNINHLLSVHQRFKFI